MLMKETQERRNSAAARSCLLLMVVGTQGSLIINFVPQQITGC
jgi:hypothetical protein